MVSINASEDRAISSEAEGSEAAKEGEARSGASVRSEGRDSSVASEGRLDLKLGDRVRFTRQMAGFRVRAHWGPGSTIVGVQVTTRDPQDGYRAEEVRRRYKELTATGEYPNGEPGSYRVVVEWEVGDRRDYDLINHGKGIIVGKTFRYEGRIDQDWEEGLLGVTAIGPNTHLYQSGRRVPCWEVKQTLSKRAVLVPLDAVELIP